MSHVPFTDEEWAEREELAAEVDDADYLARAQAQAAAEENEKMEVDVDADDDHGVETGGGALGLSIHANGTRKAESVESE